MLLTKPRITISRLDSYLKSHFLGKKLVVVWPQI